MPRRQRFKPSRKPKPAIEQSDIVEVIQPTKVDPTQEQMQSPPEQEQERPQQTSA